MPAVAGTFYPSHAGALREQLTAAYCHPLGPGQVPAVNPAGERRIVALVVPHAGYVYSGPVAAHAYAALAADGVPEVAVIVGPNHYGYGPDVAISTADGWQTPLGTLPIARDVAQALAAALPWPTQGETAHTREHSLEVQLPFLQGLYGDAVAIVPIALADQTLAVAETLGRALATVLAGRNAVIIASTDLTHYEPHAVAVAQDRSALDAMRELAAERLLAMAFRRASICGPGAVAATLIACRALGAEQAVVLKYATSGDVAGDYRQVVGYAALAFRR